MSRTSKIKRNLVTGTLLMASALTGYGRRAFAGCYPTGAPNYLCSGANYSPLSVSANNATVTTDNTFSVNTATGDALSITGDGNLISFTDIYSSSITSTSGTGLRISATGDVGGTGGVSVNASGSILAYAAGIDARNYGTGALSVTATGNVTATGMDYSLSTGLGIYARNYGTDLIINSANIDASALGIFARNYGSGALQITSSGDINAGISGIYAINNGTDLSITTAGVTSNGGGIYGRSLGTGALSITATGDVVANNFGVYASLYNGTDVDVDVGYVRGNGGIAIKDFGTGTLNLTATGTINSGGEAIRAWSFYGTDMSINLQDVYGSIGVARYGGSGALTVNAGNVEGGIFAGISAYNWSYDGTDVTVTANSITETNTDGIRAGNLGSGSLSISVSGDINAGFYGISAHNYGTDLTINTGNISSYGVGVDVTNHGSGAATITVANVTGTYGYGIRAKNYGTDLSILTGALNGRNAGIRAINYGTGALSITSTGDVTGGIYGSNWSGTDLSINVDNVDSGYGFNGITARNSGSGALTINAGDVTTRYLNVAIGAYNSYGTDLTINAGAITADYTGAGIRTFNQGTGALSITLSGDMNTSGLEGIQAVGYGTDLTINTQNIHAYGYGIEAHNRGTGALSVTAGDVVGDVGTGIIADNHGTDLTVQADTVYGGSIAGGGIIARNYGSGALSITATGNVVGAGTNSYVNGDGMGIYARNEGTDLTIGAAGASGYFAGIYARNNGSGALSITATGNVMATGTEFYPMSTGLGVYARNQGTDLVINTADVDAGVIGIFARNYGSGALQITSSGDINAGISGIYAINNGTDLSITTVGVTSNGGGIYGRNLGTGALSITATGDVVANNFGVYASVYNGTDVDVNVGYVKGHGGVAIKGFGTGAVNLTATGTINADGGEAVRASNYTGFGMSINVQDAIGSIEAKNYNYGAVTVSAGNVESSFFSGVWVYNRSFYSTDVSINVNSITTTGAEGVKASNNGIGALSVSVTGDIHAAGTGIWTYGYGTDLTINTHNVYSYFLGVEAVNHGIGEATITTGNVVGGGYGIRARNYGTDLTISTGAVSGYLGGIFAFNHGSGALSITTAGNVTAYGDAVASSREIDGIYARNYGTDLLIATAEVSGDLHGIDAINNGTGALSITTSGDITGVTGDAIYARNNSAGPLNINIPSGISVHGGGAGIDIGGNAGFGSSGIITAGEITGDNGTAISLNSLTANTPLIINGGSINGDVIDSNPAGGFSPVRFTQNFTTNGDFDVSGVEVNAGKTLTVGNGDTLMANTFTFDILNKTTFGKIAMTDTAFALRDPISAADGQIFVNVTGTDNLNGHKFQIVDGDGTHAVVNGPGNTLVAVADNSALWDFDVVDGTHFDENTSDLFLKAKKDYINNSSIANTNSLNTLLSLGDTSNPELLMAMGNINTAPTDGALNDVLASTLPDIGGSDYAASQGADDTMSALQQTRLASLRSGEDDETGMAAGDMAKGLGVWGQIFGQHADQGERDAVAGYTANTWGGAVGIDTTNIADRAVIGLAFSYGRTNASADNANTTDTDIDSYQVSIYADYDLTHNTYLSGMAGFTWGNVDTERHNVTGVPGLTAHGNYNTQQFAAQVEAGHDFAVGDGMTLTPNLLAHWTNWNPDSYTETGAGGANMHVEGDERDKFELGGGVKAGWSMKNRDGSWLKPELRASYRYDLENDQIDDTAQFTGGGVAFSVPGPNPGRSTVDLGASLKLMTTNNWTFTASYDFNWKDEYRASSGFLRAGYRF